ncbi:MAG: FecR family protein, partial [Candidatus Xenobia bacterium]
MQLSLPLAVQAGPVPVAMLLVAPTRGKVDVLTTGGTWTPLTSPRALTPGTVVRTRDNAECTLQFRDGSTIRYGADSAFRFVGLTRNEAQPVVLLKCAGKVSVDLAPQAPGVDMVFPTARLALHPALVTGRSNAPLAVTTARVRAAVDMPSGRMVRLAMLEGKVSMQPFQGLEGRMVAPAGPQALLMADASGVHRLILGGTTAIATSGPGVSTTASALVNQTSAGTALIAYGNPRAVSGSTDLSGYWVVTKLLQGNEHRVRSRGDGSPSSARKPSPDRTVYHILQSLDRLAITGIPGGQKLTGSRQGGWVTVSRWGRGRVVDGQRLEFPGRVMVRVPDYVTNVLYPGSNSYLSPQQFAESPVIALAAPGPGVTVPGGSTGVVSAGATAPVVTPAIGTVPGGSSNVPVP